MNKYILPCTGSLLIGGLIGYLIGKKMADKELEELIKTPDFRKYILDYDTKKTEYNKSGGESEGDDDDDESEDQKEEEPEPKNAKETYNIFKKAVDNMIRRDDSQFETVGSLARKREAAWGEWFLDGREEAFPLPSKEPKTIKITPPGFEEFEFGANFTQEQVSAHLFPPPYQHPLEEVEHFFETGFEELRDVPEEVKNILLTASYYDVWLDNADWINPENSGSLIVTEEAVKNPLALEQDEVWLLFGPHACTKFVRLCMDERKKDDFTVAFINELLGKFVIANVHSSGGSIYVED